MPENKKMVACNNFDDEGILKNSSPFSALQMGKQGLKEGNESMRFRKIETHPREKRNWGATCSQL